MASGNRTKYALDLNDIMSFPDADHMPIFPPKEGESWILLMEVRKVEVHSLVANSDCWLVDHRKRIYIASGLCSKRRYSIPLCRRPVYTQPEEGCREFSSRTHSVYHQCASSSIHGWPIWVQDRGSQYNSGMNSV